ncbi:hypothetical protein Tco_0791378 [Tanacetum coccineum]
MHEEAKSFNIEEWENIQATIEADEDLVQRIQAEEREKYSEAEKARLLAELINQKGGTSHSHGLNRELICLTISSDKTVPKLTAGSSKRDAEVELGHKGFKKQKTNEASGSVQEQPEEEETELPQEDLQQMMMVVLVEEVVRNHIEAYQIFAKMLKKLDKDDLVKL